jgi:DNA-binding NtrC family response regulator
MAHEIILAVDDQEAVVEVMAAALTDAGYVVHGRSDPHAALALFRERPEQFALVLLDYQMPGMRGDELLAKMCAVHPSVRALLVTSHAPETFADMLRHGLVGIMLKPFHIADLTAMVNNLLEIHQKPAPPS